MRECYSVANIQSMMIMMEMFVACKEVNLKWRWRIVSIPTLHFFHISFSPSIRQTIPVEMKFVSLILWARKGYALTHTHTSTFSNDDCDDKDIVKALKIYSRLYLFHHQISFPLEWAEGKTLIEKKDERGSDTNFELIGKIFSGMCKWVRLHFKINYEIA